jgi:alpha-tubulin suppressor-like RCC1 family protein
MKISLILLITGMMLTACGGGGGGGAAPTPILIPTPSFAIGGNVSGLSGTLTLQNNAGDDLSLTNNGSFTFNTLLNDGESYNITIKSAPTNQFCKVNNGNDIVAATNVMSISVSCGYNVSGKVTGLSGIGLVMRNSDLSNVQDETIVFHGLGTVNFHFQTPLSTGAQYAVSIDTQPSNQTCTVNPALASGTIATTLVTGVSVTCVNNTAPTGAYFVGGTISGLPNNLIGTVYLHDDNETISITSNGNFKFPSSFSDGDMYTVQVQSTPSGISCNPDLATSSGTIQGSNVNNVVINCSGVEATTYTVGGNVSHLLGTGLTLINSAAHTLQKKIIVSDGPFTLPGNLSANDSYTVVVSAQPTNPTQKCTVHNSRGTISTVSITNVIVDCGAPHTATSVAVGGGQSCAIINDGTAKCWGNDEYGQLGLGLDNTLNPNRGDESGEMGNYLPSIDFGTTLGARKIATGLLHTCAVLSDYSVKCWGYNYYGQLGQDDTIDRGALSTVATMRPIDIGKDIDGNVNLAQDVAVGGYHSCALLFDGSVKCWGRNTSGQLGQGDNSQRGDSGGTYSMANLLPISLGTNRIATQIAAGNAFTCALLDDSTVKCWGNNYHGELGQSDTKNRGDSSALGHEMGDTLLPISLGTNKTAISISAGDYHACARLDDLSVKCWGYNSSGQLGQGDDINRGDSTVLGHRMGDSLLKINLGNNHTAMQIAAGANHTCVVLDVNTVKCWGSNLVGELGADIGTTIGKLPNQMGTGLPEVQLGDTVLDITAGSSFNCARMRDQSVKCWGLNSNGQLGQGDNVSRGLISGQMGSKLPIVDLGSAP